MDMVVTCLAGASHNGDEALAHIPVHVVVLLVQLEVVGVQLHGVDLPGAKGQVGPVQGCLHLRNAILHTKQRRFVGTVAPDRILSGMARFSLPCTTQRCSRTTVQARCSGLVLGETAKHDCRIIDY